LFISLAPLVVDSSKKDKLLVEMSGSLTSQVMGLLSTAAKNKLGKRLALFYPDDAMGNLLKEEFWKYASPLGFTIVNQASFPKTVSDYRDYAKDLLGLKFVRERGEEYVLWSEIRHAISKDALKRSAILPPKIDFDWLYIPATPLEVMQIIPAFKYLEVDKLKFVGGPQWRSSHLVKNHAILGDLYFIDRPEVDKDLRLQQAFRDKYNDNPKFVESLAYDAVWVVSQVMASGKFSTRSSLKSSIEEMKSLNGFVSNFVSTNGLWGKEMSVNKISEEGMISF
jgi:ABC-type branched-subunit amino acid transport system substrate-binding protein